MAWYIPLLIFASRVIDVSCGTLRTIMVVQGLRWQPALLGFFEVVLWTLAVSGVIKYLEHPLAILGYAGGFATGVMVGSTIENFFALGFRVVRIISDDLAESVSARLRDHGWAVTRLDGEGKNGPVEIAFLVIRRRDLKRLLAQVGAIDSEAFVTVERAEKPSGGAYFSTPRRRGAWGRLATLRK
jgi:uncharacterized protein YebE (UPF0316 family)